MEATRNEVEDALGRKLHGIKEFSKHRNFKVYVNGKLIGKASVGHSWNKLDTRRLDKVARQIYVFARQLYDMAKCTKDRAWYEGHLYAKGIL